jgi:hypothetical protein
MFALFADVVQSWPHYFRDLPIGIRVQDSKFQLFFTFDGLALWPRIEATKRGETHRICFVIVAALLVADRLYAHTRMRNSQNARNGRLVGNPVCIGGKGRLEAPFTALSKNSAMNLHNLHIKKKKSSQKSNELCIVSVFVILTNQMNKPIVIIICH